MALTALEKATIGEGIQAARKIINELKPVLDRLNVIYDANTGAKVTITQNNLDLVADYSGLTKAQLDDGMYVLTATLRADIVNAYTQLVQLGSRG